MKTTQFMRSIRNNDVGVLMKKAPSIVYWLEDGLYINITNRCSNNCYFCFRNFWDGIGEFNLRLPREPSPKEVISELQKVMNKRLWREVIFCGFGEPLERLDCVLQVSKWLKKQYGKVIRVNTNGQGYLLKRGRDVARELKNAGVDKVSISLNAHDKKTYNKVCKPAYENAFESVLDFVKRAAKEFDTEITAVAVPEVNVSKIEEMAKTLGVGFRVRDYLPCFW